MEIVSVGCNHCGAPLKINEGTRFATCLFCHANLAIKQNESTIFTEVVAQFVKTNSKITDNLEVLTLQNDLEKLERDWEQKSKHPASMATIILLIIIGVASPIIVWVLTAHSLQGWEYFLFFAFVLVFLTFIIFAIVMSNFEVREYNAALNKYLEFKRFLEKKLYRARTRQVAPMRKEEVSIKHNE